MRRWDMVYICEDSDRMEMVEVLDGDYVLHADAIELLNAANENTLAAMRRETHALDAADALRAEVATLRAEIKHLNDVIGEMSE